MILMYQLMILFLTIFLLSSTSSGNVKYPRIFLLLEATIVFLLSLYVVNSIEGLGYFYRSTLMLDLGAFLIKIRVVIKITKYLYWVFLFSNGLTLGTLLVLWNEKHFKNFVIGLVFTELALLLIIVNVPFIFA